MLEKASMLFLFHDQVRCLLLESHVQNGCGSLPPDIGPIEVLLLQKKDFKLDNNRLVDGRLHSCTDTIEHIPSTEALPYHYFISLHWCTFANLL